MSTTQQRVEQIRGRLDALLAGGLAHTPADEVTDIAASLESMQLAQPATVLKGIATAAAGRSLEARHFEDLIKVMRLLEQVATKLVGFETLDSAGLEPVGLYHGLYIDSEAVRPMLDEPLEQILQIRDRYVSAYLLNRYAAKMSLEDLESRMGVLWSDARLMPLVVGRLRSEPAEALRLAKMALELPLRMARRTAVRVLEVVEVPTASEVLASLLEAGDPVVAYEARAALSTRTGHRQEFQTWADSIIRMREGTLRTLAEGATKEDRAEAARMLRDTRSPVFIRPLRLALKDVAGDVRAMALEALGFVGDVQIADDITEDTFTSDSMASGAAEGLAEVGDVRGFELLWRLYLANKRPVIVPQALQKMPHFLMNRLFESLCDRKLIARSTMAQLVENLDPGEFAARVRRAYDQNLDPKWLENAARLAGHRRELVEALLAAWPADRPEPIEKLQTAFSATVAALKKTSVWPGLAGLFGRKKP